MTKVDYICVTVALAATTFIAGCTKQGEGDRVEHTLDSGKETSNLKDLKEGAAEIRIPGDQKVPPKAEQLHRAARAKGEAGDYAGALSLLRQASEIAPDWPYPVYDMAFTYLIQGDTTNAFLKYREVDRLEPRGFFTTKTALWTLQREDQGVFPKGTYLAYLSLEWVDAAKKREMVGQIVTNLPAFAPAWKERALLVEDADQRLAFFEKALSLDPDPETYGICTLNKAALLNSSGRVAEAKRMIEALSTNDSSTLGTKALAIEFLKTQAK